MNFGTGGGWGSAMRTCEGCGRDFVWHRGTWMTCPYCGYDTNPRSHMPRSPASIERLDQERREREEEEEELREYFDLEPD